MVFTTFTFIVFLTVAFSGYWMLRYRSAQNLWILVLSYYFYAWWDWRFSFLMLSNSLFDYFAGLGLMRTNRPGPRQAILIASMLANLLMLGFFKYFGFFTENLRIAMQAVGWTIDEITLNIVLPVGISFYTFQTMSYTIDIYRRKMSATSNIVDYLAYVSFFPQLVAGPIERAIDLLPQFFVPRHFNYPLAIDGCRQMLMGFFKKMVLADNLGLIVNRFYEDPNANGVVMAFATVCFAFQIYCDFSGYTDIAIGMARWFGFSLTRNFAFPYFSQNVTEFWRRWHITLSTWFRDYVYIPLGGNRVSKPRQLWNVMVTFVISGFWHGASWNYVVWGALNGAAILPTMMSGNDKTLQVGDTPGGRGLLPRPSVLAKIIGTFTIICVGWVFFRARTMRDAFGVLGRVFTDVWSPAHYASAMAQVASVGITSRVAILALPAFVLLEWIQREHQHSLARLPRSRPVRWAIYTMIVWMCVFQESSGANAFIYFQF